MSYKIIDNFLLSEDHKKIKESLMSVNFPWFYHENMTYTTKNENDDFQFVHPFYSNFVPQSDYIKILSELIDKINPRSLIRIKANLQTKSEKIKIHDFHVDYEYEDSLSAVYYVNTNNGKTIFKNGGEIDSLENRLLIFNTNEYHAKTSFTDTNVRIIINLNYF